MRKFVKNNWVEIVAVFGVISWYRIRIPRLPTHGVVF